MKSNEIRNRFIDYFTKKLAEQDMEHKEVPSSKLVPERHPTLLFVNSGMVQFTPYFLGEKDPQKDFGNTRLCSVQKCIRTGDLSIIGKSKYHLVLFEMLGSWSIGNYGKKQAVEFAFELLTNKEYGFGLDHNKFICTVFEGNEEAECDIETIEAWKSVGIPENRISKLPASENWWSPGPVGPCGPCTEVLYDRGEAYGKEEETPGLTENPRYLEIWNAGVFMQYNRNENGELTPLKQMSVDTGAGLERFALLLQNVDSVFDTDLFLPIIDQIKNLTTKTEKKEEMQRAANHIKSAIFIASENVVASNKDQGYVLRRLLRDTYDTFMWELGIEPKKILDFVNTVAEMYREPYPELKESKETIKKTFLKEIEIYTKTTNRVRNHITKNYTNKGLKVIENPFDLYQSQGASVELIENLVSEQNITVNWVGFEEKLEEHQNKSKKGAGDKFLGGLGDHSEQTIKYHTATHLLHWALREVLGQQIEQKGSNITGERLRFDFSHNSKLTEEQINQVQTKINEKIALKIPVKHTIMPKEDAEKTGALHFFGEKYGASVKVYYIGDSLETAFSKEFCGGPHVENTGDIGKIEIFKQKKIGDGLVRLYAR